MEHILGKSKGKFGASTNLNNLIFFQKKKNMSKGAILISPNKVKLYGHLQIGKFENSSEFASYII